MPHLLVLLLVLLVGCGAGSPARPTAAAPAPVATPFPRQVVIVSIDGLRPDAVLKGESPNIQALAARGAYTWEAKTILPSNTLPSHVSMLTAFPPEVHGILWDEYAPLRGRLTVPSVFTAVRAAGMRSAMVVGKNKFDYFRDTGVVDEYVLAAGGDDEVAARAALATQSGFNLVFAHLPDVHLSGHARVAAVPWWATVILTADHGGGSRANNHGSDAACDMTIPWIASGPGTLRGHRLSAPVRTTDTAATAAWVLGIDLPAGVTGEAVTDAFAPGRPNR